MPALLELDFQQTAGQGCTVDGRVDYIQNVTDGSGVVFMPVRDKNATNIQAFQIVSVVTQVGDDVVNARHIEFREHEASIDNDGIIAVLKDHHVFTNFT